MRGVLGVGGIALAVLISGVGSAAQPRIDYAGVALNILPPGEEGNFTYGEHSTDQAKLYDALTPRFGAVKPRDLRRFFKPERFGAAGTAERVPRRDVRIVRDRWGVAHVFGRTTAAVEWGAGWVTAADRSWLLEVIRGPGRVAALDGPSYDQTLPFVPTPQTEAELASQVALLERSRRGRQVLRDVDAYIAGINAFHQAHHANVAPWTRVDTIAAGALLGATFGVAGGDEARRAEFLSALQQRLGAVKGREVWDDLREQQDPETPVTAAGRSPFGINTSEAGSAPIDAGSLREAPPAAEPRSMSNALVVAAKRSRTHHPLYVAGPQVGYFYPEFFLELDLHGGGIDARGVAFPGLPYVVIGRGKDFAWSATTSHSDIVDQYVETLCGDDVHYVYEGSCRAMGTVAAGVVKAPSGDRPMIFHTTVHGPVVGYATSNGKRVAISRRRSTHGREVMSLFGLSDLDRNRVTSARSFLRVVNEIEFGFNFTYADNRDIAYFSAGRLPIRPPDVDLGLPTRGTGAYEWRGIASQRAHAQAIDPPSGVIVNWNNKPAPGYAAADDKWSYGSLQRVQLLARNLTTRRKHTLTSVVAAMNKAATQDFRTVMVLPTVAAVLKTGAAPTARDAELLQMLERWRARGASRLDRNLDGKIDDPGAAIMDAAWPRIARAVMTPVLGPLTARLEKLSRIDDPPNPVGSSFDDGWYGYVDKDLRTLLGRRVRGRFHVRYCGGGDLASCRASLWAALDAAGAELARAQGGAPSQWRADARPERIVFSPGFVSRTMRWTNRATFQQVITFTGHRRRR